MSIKQMGIIITNVLVLLSLLLVRRTILLSMQTSFSIDLSEEESVFVEEDTLKFPHFTIMQWGMETDLSKANASFIGEDTEDNSGYSVAGAGDVNADGFDDILIGAHRDDDGGTDAGQTYLILGQPSVEWQMGLDLSAANASFIGENSYDYSGYSVTGAGDVNTDGFDDILIGAYGAGGMAGKTYLILGRPTKDWQMGLNLSAANASFIGEDSMDSSGVSVAGVGDVNADNFDDILIGAHLDSDGGADAGQTYLILGRPTEKWQMGLDLSAANASFIGENNGDYSGWSVARAGDVNADGFDDILIGALNNDEGGTDAGQTYLILGRPTAAWQMDLELSAANASFIGEDADDLLGYSVAGAGDVNADNFDDILIGAVGNEDGGNMAGQSYLILGRPTAAWQMGLNLSATNASFIGEDAEDRSGCSVAGVGDANADGFDDFLIGALGDEEGGNFAGQTYLILGRPTAAWQMRLNLSAANASFIGEDADDRSGDSVSGAGDVNNDGADDLLIGAYRDDDGGTDAGQTYLILTKDLFPPAIDIKNPTSRIYNQKFINFSYSISEEVFASVFIYLDGVANKTAIPSGSIISGLSDGNHNITIIAIDLYGNVGKTSIIFTVDDTPPIIIIDSPLPTLHTTDIINIDLFGNAACYWYYIANVDSDNITWISSTQRSLDDGTYTLHVYGNDSANNIDHRRVTFTIDTILPTIDHPEDVIYEEGTSNHTITWVPYDVNPSSFLVKRDGIAIVGGPWIGNQIIVNVDTLSLGSYNYICTVYDQAGTLANDSVAVTVVDTTPPIIDHPADIIYDEEDFWLGTITWNPSDPHPAFYNVTLNDTPLESGLWDGGSITVTFYELVSGNYTFVCTVWDQSGNNVRDNVFVSILKKSSPTTWPSLFLSLGAICITVVLRQHIKKSKC